VPDRIDGWLDRFDAALHVHGRRRARIRLELEDQLHESASHHGEDEALRRLGNPEACAAEFTPRLVDRLWEQRDRAAALVMLAAMAASAPLAFDLGSLGRHAGSSAWIGFLVLVLPATLVASASCALVLAGRPAGRRLVLPLVVLVAVTAVFTLVPLPPASQTFDAYERGVGLGLNYTAGAIVLTTLYAAAVTGWAPRRRRPTTATT
jgi:uncharacterized membrane protein